MALPLVLCGVLIVMGVLYAWHVWGVAKRTAASSTAAFQTAGWNRLLLACRGEQTLALRLRDAEKERSDDLSDEDACERAYQRLLRDRE